MDSFSINFIIEFGIPAVLIAIAFFSGSYVERRHFRSIRKREEELRGVLLFALRRVPADLTISEPRMIQGSVVVSADYFKAFVAFLRGIIGGRMGTYEALVERARREAIVRLKQRARELKKDLVLNVKFETVRIHAGIGNTVISVEALVYGTAYQRNESA